MGGVRERRVDVVEASAAHALAEGVPVQEVEWRCPGFDVEQWVASIMSTPAKDPHFGEEAVDEPVRDCDC